MPSYKFQNRPAPKPFVAEGEYTLTVKDYKTGVTKKSGNEYIELECIVEGQGSHVYDFLTFTDKAEWWIDSFLVAIGKAPKLGGGVDFGDDLLKGATGRARLGVEEYENRDGKKSQRNTVVAWLPQACRQASKPEPAGDFD